MRAYGSDRLRVADDGSIELSSRLPKREWYARTAKTLTRRERPGTAVLWDDACYEVVRVTTLPQGVRYTLVPWSESETMRVTTRYDAETEAAREAERRDVIRREKQRHAVNLFAFVFGHAPGAVQQRLANEVNVDAAALTMWSTLPVWIAVLVTALINASRMLHKQPLLPFWWNVSAFYLLVESVVRFKMAWISRRAMGSAAGVVLYTIFYAFNPRRAQLPAPIDMRKGEGVRIVIPEDDGLWSAFHAREPLLTLLDVRDQQLLRERFGFDYRRDAKSVAAFVLAVAIIGAVTSIKTLMETPRFSAFTSLVVASILAIEQLWRLTQFSKGPASSILRFAVRPLAKKLLT